jgi:hypothetical protein
MEKEMAKNTTAAAVPAPLEPEAVIEQLRALREQIPEYGQLTIKRSQALHAASRADAGFVQAAIASVGASEVVRQAVGVSADDLRREVDLAGRWSAVEDELRALLQGVAAANLTRRHRIALSGLQAYNIGRQLVRKDQNSDLLPHVAEMRRLNRFGRRRKAAQPDGKEPTPPPAPIPHV